MSDETQQTAFDLIPFADHEPVEQTTFNLTCLNGTVFTLPSNHPDITAGGIGGVAYGEILEDPSLMPEQFNQFCTFRPARPKIGKFTMDIINKKLAELIPGWKA